ncbi:MAG: transcriptional activator NhaR [Vicinamibacterales bacterium]
MEWLNYHHLLYFWTVARAGSIARASEELRLAQPTISGQIRALEDQLGEKLFERTGRRLVLTDVGRIAFQYADDIFGLGRELLDTLKDRPTGRPMRLQVGIADEVNKTVAYRLLEPALDIGQPVHLICREGRPDALVALLATHHLDVVIAEAPVPPSVKVKAFNHLLGTSSLTVFGAPRLAATMRRGFPGSLHGTAMLLPGDGTPVRRALDLWFETKRVRPRVAGEFDDSALAQAFGQFGRGLFVAPTVVEAEIVKQYGVKAVGRIPEVGARYYAISIDRKLRHPAVVAISEAAHEWLDTPASRAPGRGNGDG